MNNLLITKENKKTKRFILVFLLFTIYFFNGSLILAQNERIRVNVKNESVEVVLKKITKQTGVNFFYDQKKISQSSRVNLNVSNQTIETVLKSLSIQTGLYFNRNKNTINVGFDTKEKGLKILKGKVVDQNGEAVIGASIQVPYPTTTTSSKSSVSSRKVTSANFFEFAFRIMV